MSSDEKLGADLPSGPFQRRHRCIPSCCFLPALNHSLPASCSCSGSGKQAAQSDAWTMPGLRAGLLFPSYAIRRVLSCLAVCPLPPATALSLALQGPLGGTLVPHPLPNPRPRQCVSQVMVSRRNMQQTKSEKPILLAASPYRRTIRRRSCSLAARPAEGRAMTALGTHCGMMDGLCWPSAKKLGLSLSPPPCHGGSPLHPWMAASLSPKICV